MVTFDYWGFGTYSVNLTLYAITGTCVIIAVLLIGIWAGRKMSR